MSIARTVALVLGVVYVLVGIVGFLPAPLVTENMTDAASGAILGIFPINALHNVVHLAIGAALLYGSTATSAAVLVSRIVGAVYIVVGLLGFVSPSTFGLMPIGGADIFLHLGTGLVLLFIGFSQVDEPTMAPAR